MTPPKPALDETSQSVVKVPNAFLDRIRAGQITSVVSIKMMTSNEIPMMCKIAGHHAVFIDMEHSTLDLAAVGQLALACNYVGVSPIVRSPSKSHWHISRILDAGAVAVVIPHIDTVQEVKDIVAAGKFAPIGHRGSSSSQPIFSFQSVPSAVSNPLLNTETMIIPMIETIPSLAIVDEILALEGVDGLLIGGNDLSCELGVPAQYDHPLMVDAITNVITAAKQAGKPVGIGGMGSRKDLLEKFFVMGASWSLSAADVGLLQAGLKSLGKEYQAMNERVCSARAEPS